MQIPFHFWILTIIYVSLCVRADIFLSIPTMKVPTHSHSAFQWINTLFGSCGGSTECIPSSSCICTQLRIKFLYNTNIGNAFCMQMGKNAYDYPNRAAIRSETATRTPSTALRMFVFHLLFKMGIKFERKPTASTRVKECRN